MHEMPVDEKKPMTWSRHCPMTMCRKLLTKDDPFDDWVCSCGWHSADDVSSRYATKSNEERIR
jgi:hypothetical protein